jgi:hypothetical protein
MVLVLCFFKHRYWQRVFKSAYMHVEMLVAAGPRSMAFSISPGGVFSGMEPEQLDITDEHYDFAVLPTSPLEDDMILRTCEACSQSFIRYNAWDTALSSLLPAGFAADVDLYHAPTLHAAQAVVLVLRECLDPGNPVLRPLQAMNSRAINAAQLARRLRDVSQPVNESSVGKLIGGGVLGVV